MIEQTVKDRIQTCYQICALIDANSTDNRTLPLKDMLRIEFLKFSSYLVDLDGTIDQEELNCIRDYLQFDLTSGALKNFKENEGVRSDFLKQPPVILKHFVLADAKKMIANDPYEHQAAQILTDTYKIYGQMLISCHATEQTDSRSVETLTNYITLLENFLKEYGVWKYSSDRLFPVTDISSTPTDTPDLSDEETVEALLEELNQLTGLTQVKEEVNRLVNLIRVQKLRAERGFKNSSSSLHMVFSGNQGTGKTTVATIFAKSLNIPYRSLNATIHNKKDIEIVIDSHIVSGIKVVVSSEITSMEVRENAENRRFFKTIQGKHQDVASL